MVKRVRFFFQFFSGVPSALLLFWSARGSTPWLALSCLFGWSVIMCAVLWRLRRLYQSRVNLPVIAALMLLSGVTLSGLSESFGFLAIQSVLYGVMISYIFTASFQTAEDNAILYKPVRRILTMIMVFVGYATTTFAFALSVFFPDIPFFIITLVVGVALAIYTGIIWSMYNITVWRTDKVWLFAFAVVFSELTWVIHLLPFGYFASGLLLSWLWYVSILLGRFHISAMGIDWKRQFWFLVINFVLYIATLAFFVRWV